MLAAPWWVSAILAAGVWMAEFVLVDSLHLPGWETNPLLGLFDKILHGPLRNLSWLLIAALLACSLISFVRATARAAMLDRQCGIDSIKQLSWQEFEKLVAEAYERLGHQVAVNSQQGADGGVDLLLRKDGKKILVQCKRWKTSSVGAAIVREMYGLLTHHGADAVKIVCIGEFTKDAQAFAQGKAIELVSGADLVRLIRSVQTVPRDTAAAPPAAVPVAVTTHGDAPICQKCGSVMVKRTARKTQSAFFGCSAWPKCNGTQNEY